ncbi:hypothetical protein SAMD00019534_124030, partial [Acytostelium subglobosum LB1]|uniref:hypothetical protein n=1 Tax=Acytostelium subglobosum LB1 TaxID=1410327 RepID=UPI0006447C10
MYQARSRAGELLNELKNEVDNLNHDLGLYKIHKDEYERKFQSQMQELQHIQQSLIELERTHNRVKGQYEDEIMRLKKQLEQATGSRDLNSPSTFRSQSPAPASVGQARSTPTPTIPDKAPRRRSGEFYPQQPGQPPQLPQQGGGGVGGAPSFPALSSIDQRLKQEKKGVEIEPMEQQHPKENMGDERRRYSEADDNAKEGQDWLVGYNPNVQTNLNIDLAHTFMHGSVVCCVKFSPDGKYLASGCNRNATIYDTETGRNVCQFYDDGDKEGDLYIRSVCFSPDGKYLATGAEDRTVKVWDIAHKKVHQKFSGHELDIYSLDYSQDGRFIVSGSGDKKAKIWDLKEGRCAFTLGNEEVGPKNGVTSVAISPDGRLVAAGSLDNIVRLWDAHSGYFLERYEGHMDSVYSVAFSPDGKSLASGSLDKTLKLWDLSGSRSRSRCRSTFTGHKDFVLSVAFSPCGNWLISGSKDRSVQFWDPKTGTTHMMLQGHKNSVISVALSPKGGLFATGSGDSRARLWKYDS